MKTRFFFGVFAGFAFACFLYFFFAYFFPGTFRAVAYHADDSQTVYSASCYHPRYVEGGAVAVNYGVEYSSYVAEEYSPYVDKLVAYNDYYSAYSGGLVDYVGRHTQLYDMAVAHGGAYAHDGVAPVV